MGNPIDPVKGTKPVWNTKKLFQPLSQITLINVDSVLFYTNSDMLKLQIYLFYVIWLG